MSTLEILSRDINKRTFNDSEAAEMFLANLMGAIADLRRQFRCNECNAFENYKPLVIPKEPASFDTRLLLDGKVRPICSVIRQNLGQEACVNRKAVFEY